MSDSSGWYNFFLSSFCFLSPFFSFADLQIFQLKNGRSNRSAIFNEYSDGILGFSVTMKRGCGQSVVATASSVGGNSISVSSYSCSTDLCNTGDAKQKLNVNTFNDFLGDLKVANNPAPYQGYYPTFNAGLFQIPSLPLS